MKGETRLKQQEGFGINPLEKLYTLEKVDPKTIRTYVPATLPKIKGEKSFILEPYREIGGGYPVLALYDILDRLKLPPPLQYQLKKEGWKSVMELLQAEQEAHPKILALPGAHQQMLKSALAPWKELIRCGKTTKLDFKGYFRGLGIAIDPISYLTLLHSIGLSHFMEATPYERIQVERLSQKEREEKIGSALEKVILNEEIEAIFHGLLFGWIEERGGITTKKEIAERLEQEAVDQGAANGFLDLLEVKKRLPGYSVAGIWFFDRTLKKQLELILFCLKGLFYKPHMSYDLKQIEELIQSELIKKGEWLDTLLLKRYLLLSNMYRLEKRDLLNYVVHL